METDVKKFQVSRAERDVEYGRKSKGARDGTGRRKLERKGGKLVEQAL